MSRNTTTIYDGVLFIGSVDSADEHLNKIRRAT